MLPLIAPANLRLMNPREAYGDPEDAATFRREFLELAQAGDYVRAEWRPEVVGQGVCGIRGLRRTRTDRA